MHYILKKVHKKLVTGMLQYILLLGMLLHIFFNTDHYCMTLHLLCFSEMMPNQIQSAFLNPRRILVKTIQRIAAMPLTED